MDIRNNNLATDGINPNPTGNVNLPPPLYKHKGAPATQGSASQGMGNVNKLDDRLNSKEKATKKNKGDGGDKIVEEDMDYLDGMSKPQIQVINVYQHRMLVRL